MWSSSENRYLNKEVFSFEEVNATLRIDLTLNGESCSPPDPPGFYNNHSNYLWADPKFDFYCLEAVYPPCWKHANAPKNCSAYAYKDEWTNSNPNCENSGSANSREKPKSDTT
jgi:hypothetical protein